MGRLTLNMLLSFAQFEREIAGERIRDKIRASKAKGMWMGGTVPLGYAAIDKKLVIAENEAATVRMVFERYLELGSVSHLRRELNAKGVVGRKPQGADRPGPRFGRGALYTLLSNPVYRGKVRHGDQLYDGRHDPIIGQDIWDRTQALLAENRQAVRRGDAAKSPSLLAGLVIDADGDRMTATHANKSGRRYRYYVSSRLITEKRSASPTAMRVPAGDLETLVLSRLRQFLTSSEEIGSALAALSLDAMQIEAAMARASEIADNCVQDRPAIAAQIVGNIVERIEVSETLTTLMMKRDALASELGVIPLKVSTESATTITLRIEATLRRAGRGKRLVLGNAIADQRNDALINLVARALTTRERLLSGEVESVQQMSEGSGRSREQTTRLIRLSYLAPDIVRAILDGHQPVGLTVKALMVAAKDLPTRWEAQRKLLGFSHASRNL